MTSASSETASDESASDEDAFDDLRNLISSELLFFICFYYSDAFLQHKLPFCRFQCSSFVLPEPVLDFKDTNFLSMVIHT